MMRSAWPRVLPFAAFIGFIALEQGLVYLQQQGWLAFDQSALLFLYPVRVIIVGLLLWVCHKYYAEVTWRDLFAWRQTILSLGLGVLVFVLWINMDWSFATFGESRGFDPTQIESASLRSGLVLFRLLGAALLVPVIEELFWRSFLLRYIINADFSAVAIGTFRWPSFVIGALLFGVEHHLVLAGIMAGVAYSVLLYRTKSIVQCILSHAVTNLCLGIYVLQTGQWQFW